MSILYRLYANYNSATRQIENLISTTRESLIGMIQQFFIIIQLNLLTLYVKTYKTLELLITLKLFVIHINHIDR